MKLHKSYIILGLLIAFGLFFELAAHASESNELTTLTFSAPVQIPGRVLPAGTYTFEQLEPDIAPDVVQVFGADGSLIATLNTVSADRMDPTGDTTITLADGGNGTPPALLTWFYPGRIIGHEFVYGKDDRKAIAQSKQTTFEGDRVVSGADSAGD